MVLKLYLVIHEIAFESVFEKLRVIIEEFMSLGYLLWNLKQIKFLVILNVNNSCIVFPNHLMIHNLNIEEETLIFEDPVDNHLELLLL